MIRKLPEEIEQQVVETADGMARFEGANGSYYVLSEEAMRIRESVQLGIQEADAGDVSPWDVDEAKAEVRRRLDQQRPS